MSGEAGTASEGTCLPQSVALGACGDQRGDRAIRTVGWMARDGSQALHPRSPLSGAAGPGSEGGGVSRGFGPAVEDTGRPRPGSCPPAGGAARAGAGAPLRAATCAPCPSATSVFQDPLCQRQQLCGKDEEDGEFSVCLCSWRGVAALAAGEGGPAEGQLPWSGGRSGLEHSHLTKASKVLCFPGTPYPPMFTW